MKEYKVGQIAVTDGITSMAAYGGPEKITKVRYKFDENSGKKYQQFKLESGPWWNSETLQPIGNRWMYEIISIDGKEV